MEKIETMNSWDKDQVPTKETSSPPSDTESSRMVKVWNYSAKRRPDQPIMTFNQIG
jgi:hypothetical protein